MLPEEAVIPARLVAKSTLRGLDPAGEAHGFGAAGPTGEILVALSSAGDDGQLGGGQGRAGVEAEVDAAQQRGRDVDGAGAFSGHLVAGQAQASPPPIGGDTPGDIVRGCDRLTDRLGSIRWSRRKPSMAVRWRR